MRTVKRDRFANRDDMSDKIAAVAHIGCPPAAAGGTGAVTIELAAVLPECLYGWDMDGNAGVSA